MLSVLVGAGGGSSATLSGRARMKADTGESALHEDGPTAQLHPDQQREAIKRRDLGEESLTENGRSYNVSAATHPDRRAPEAQRAMKV